MKPINSRFFITNNGIIYDVDTNYVFKPRHSEFHTSTLLSLSLPKNLNRAVLLRAEYNAGGSDSVIKTIDSMDEGELRDWLKKLVTGDMELGVKIISNGGK